MRFSLGSLRVRLLALMLLALLPPVGLVIYTDFEQRQDQLRDAGMELYRLARLLVLEEDPAGDSLPNMVSLRSKVARADLPAGALLVLLDSRGTVLTTLPEEGSAVGQPALSVAELRMHVEQPGAPPIEVAMPDGVVRIFAVVQDVSQGGRFYLGLGVPKDLILRDVNRTLARNVLILGLVGLLLFEAAWVGGDLFVLRHINPLVVAARRLTTGDLGSRTGVTYGGGEFGDLARAFDEMAESLAEAEEQKRIDEALRRRNYELEQQNLAIQEADRLKGEFVSMVSHELRTPLTSINGYVHLLLDGDVGKVSGEQRECLVAIRDNGRRLLTLITDLLEISRIEADRIELKPALLDVRPVIEAVAASFRPQLGSKAQHLILDLPQDLAPAYADADRVAQILTNLVANAHKYTQREGTITIRAGREGGYVRVDVEDDGIGLSERELSQVFAKFYRVQSEATRGVTGTGLGLAITRSLVEAHHGKVVARSTPGQGSTFSFTLPVQPPTSA